MASNPTRLRVAIAKQYLHRCTETGKIKYADKDAAHEIAELMMRREQVKPGCHITPYQCLDCGWWHVRNRVIVCL